MKIHTSYRSLTQYMNIHMDKQYIYYSILYTTLYSSSHSQSKLSKENLSDLVLLPEYINIVDN